MARLEFQLDDDLMPVFGAVAGDGYVPDANAILLIQVIRMLQRAEDRGTGEHPRPKPAVDVELMPVSTPADPHAKQLVDAIRQPGRMLRESMQEVAESPLPGTPTPTTDQLDQTLQELDDEFEPIDVPQQPGQPAPQQPAPQQPAPPAATPSVRLVRPVQR